MKALALIAIAALVGCGDDLSKPAVSSDEKQDATLTQCLPCFEQVDRCKTGRYNPPDTHECAEGTWCPTWCDVNACIQFEQEGSFCGPT